MTLALARSLLLADAVTPTALAEALFLSATRGTSLVRTLLAARAIDTLRLEQMLERGEAPYMRHIAPVSTLVERLPAGLCDRLLAMPVRRDPRTGTVDVAVVDARDPHPAEEIGYWLRAPVRIVRTSIASMESALLRLEARVDTERDPGMRALAPPIWAPPPTPAPPIPAHLMRTPMYGTPAASARAKSEPPPEDFDLAIPLTRRNFGAPPVADVALEAVSFASTPVEIGLPAIERTTRRGDSDPVLDLRKRKPVGRTAPVDPGPVPARPAQVDPGYEPASTVRGPFAPARTLPPPPLETPPPPETPSPAARPPAATTLSPTAPSQAAAIPSGAAAPPAATTLSPTAPTASAPATAPLPATAPASRAPSMPPASAEEAAAIVEQMRGARDRDQILELLVAGTRTVAGRAVVLAVRRDALVGWTGSGEVADRPALRAVRLPNTQPTVLHDSLEQSGARTVRIPADAAHTPLLAVMSPPPTGHDVVVAAVQAEGRPVALVLADGIGDPQAALEILGDLARAAGDALGRLLRDRRG